MTFDTFIGILIFLFVALVSTTAINVALGVNPAFPQQMQLRHDLNDPAHWYPYDCCHERDCEVIPIDGITETELGWQVRYVSKKLGEVNAFVPAKHEKVKPNEHDGQFHGCFRRGGFPGGFGNIPDKVMRQFICFWYPVNV